MTTHTQQAGLPGVPTTGQVLALKRRIYLYGLVVGLAAIVLAWAFRARAGQITSLERGLFPLLTLLCGASWLLLWRSPRPLLLVEVLLFAGAALGLLARHYDVLFSPVGLQAQGRAQAFSDLFYWFPLVYVLAFLSLDRRLRVFGSLLFLGAATGIGLAYILARQPGAQVVYLLARFFLANLVFVVLLTVSNRLNQEYVATRLLAEAMTGLALTDPLVKIANRRQLERSLAREVSRAQRYERLLSVAMLDVDHFKQVNDTHGHDVGDQVLREVGRALQSHARSSDLAGRWGGEEFLIVMPETPLQEAVEIGERLRAAIEKLEVQRAGRVTVSVGLATFRPEDTVESLVGRADQALYRAKERGRNRVEPAP